MNFFKHILQTLLEALMPEWQVMGILELFRMYERQESFCRGSTQVRHTILRTIVSQRFFFLLLTIVRSYLI